LQPRLELGRNAPAVDLRLHALRRSTLATFPPRTLHICLTPRADPSRRPVPHAAAERRHVIIAASTGSGITRCPQFEVVPANPLPRCPRVHGLPRRRLEFPRP